MSTFRVAVIAATCAGWMLACSSKDDDEADKKPNKNPTPAKTRTAKTVKTPTPKPTPQPPTCVRVLATKPITDGSGTMKVTVNKDVLETVFDPKAEYRKNPVWESIDTPAACGLVTSTDRLNLVAFFRESGQPSLQVRIINAKGGVHKLDGKARTLGGMVTSDGLHYALYFKKGTLTITPKKLVPGKVTIKIENGAGVALRKGKKADFTLAGSFTATLEKRPAAPAKKPPTKGKPHDHKAPK